MNDENNSHQDHVSAALEIAATKRAERLADRAPIGVGDVHQRVNHKRQQRRTFTSVAAGALVLAGAGGLYALGQRSEAPAAANASAPVSTAPPTTVVSNDAASETSMEEAVWGCRDSVAPPANVDTSTYENFYSSCDLIASNDLQRTGPAISTPDVPRNKMADAINENSVDYVVQEGDTFESIAAQFNTSPELLRAMYGRPNGEVTAGETIHVRTDVTVTGSLLPRFNDSATDPAIGMAAPVVQGFDLNGNAITIDAAAAGHPILVVDVAHWCPHCAATVATVMAIANEGGLPAGMEVVLISSDEGPDRPNFPASDWLASQGWTGPTLNDPGFSFHDSSGDFQGTTATLAYGIAGYPFTMVIGADGTVRDRWTGGLSDTDLVARINAAVQQ